MCLTRVPSHPCHYSSPVVMTINHSIPHQQLLPNVTLLLIKIHPAARHWGTNDLEIGCCVSRPSHKMLAAPPGEEVRCGEGGRKRGGGDTELCARPLRDRICLTLETIYFLEGKLRLWEPSMKKINPKFVWILCGTPSSRERQAQETPRSNSEKD